MAAARRMIGEILAELGVVSVQQVQQALRQQMGGDTKKIGEILVAEGICTTEDITQALAEQHELDMVDLDGIDVPRDVVSMVEGALARQHHIVPIDFAEGMLTVALSDPLDLYGLDELRFVLSCNIEPVLATHDAIDRALTNYYGLEEGQVDELLGQMGEDDVEIVQTGDVEGGEEGADDAPIIKLVYQILTNAVKARASDIHVEPMANRIRLRYRVDGVCFDVEAPPKRLQGPIISRIKIMSGMDMAEKRRTQDGRIKINVAGKELDLRVSALPANHGESIVMRILDRENLLLGLADLGFHADDLRTFNALIKKPNGILLITGPTGSGKTTTLYSALQELNRSDRKIITAEEPVEYHISGINQCEVRRKIGMTFQRILRAMLRQAPNIILVGEIRDKETAEIAVQAALTGHLVFSTLHTNDAPSAITRLIDMGVAPFLVASSIQAIMAQRLVRNICNDCKVPTKPDIVRLKAVGLRDEQIQGRTFYVGQGCASCRDSGYRGRKGLFEMMVMNSRLRELAFNKDSTDNLRAQALRDGMSTLFMDGLRKVLDGITTLEEVLAEAKIVV
ncbi:MAG: GspE/PulE family protein [Planctomycetota bacterium]